MVLMNRVLSGSETSRLNFELLIWRYGVEAVPAANRTTISLLSVCPGRGQGSAPSGWGGAGTSSEIHLLGQTNPVLVDSEGAAPERVPMTPQMSYTCEAARSGRPPSEVARRVAWSSCRWRRTFSATRPILSIAINLKRPITRRRHITTSKNGRGETAREAEGTDPACN